MKNIFKKIIIFLLEIEARLVLKKYKPNIIAITGSVGKTSTKDAIYSVLSTSFFVRKSEKSFNSEIGLPLTILGCPNAWSNLFLWMKNLFEGALLILLRNHYPKWLVLEVGADRPGDISSIAKWLKPDIVVMTRIPEVPVHIEFFKSLEMLVEEKAYLVKALKKDGVLVLNKDDSLVVSFRNMAENVVTYGFEQGANFLASDMSILYEEGKPCGVKFRVDCKGCSVPVEIKGVLGRGHIESALAALAVGVNQNINIVLIGEALSGHSAPPGRMKILDGIEGSVIIDDSYNSSPVALEEALNTINEVTVPGRKIVVLGDMLELGSFSVDEHRRAGKQAASIADILITVGVRARHIIEGAQEAEMKKQDILQFSESKEAGIKIKELIKNGDLILIKGSQGVRMEKVVEVIMAHPEKKKELLVRQEDEWLRR